MLSVALLPGLAAAQPGPQGWPIFFEPWSAALDENARALIRTAAALAAARPTAAVQVIGFADPEGAPDTNRALSLTRARVVRDALVEAGVAEARIRVSARGATEYVENSLESRRVEIVVGN
jgi:outer membrane protein OmpA-like peptidoglycan-associated protein